MRKSCRCSITALRAGALLCLLIAACAPSLAEPGAAQGDVSPRGIREFVDSSAGSYRIDREVLQRFYGSRSFRPAWAGGATAEHARAEALAALAHAAEHGLEAEDYSIEAGTSQLWRAGTEAERDVLLTDAFLRYMRDMRLGRTSPAEVSGAVDLPAQSYDPVAALQQALANDRLPQLLADLPPRAPAYAALKVALARYRVLAVGGWPSIPLGPTFDAYAVDPRIVPLRRRLAVEDPELIVSPTLGSHELDLAIRRYQARNGLDADGRVGTRTLASLNVSAGERVDQLRANMERWRWLPHVFEDRYVMVNVAEAQLKVIDRGAVRLSSRVIVGDRRHPSPMFRASAIQITVNPPWNVPLSIARAEVLPKLRRDRNYLRNEDMIVLNGAPDDPYGLKVDWRSVPAAGSHYWFQQRPGPRNALGVIKLELPNRFDIYLHDTPARNLFAREDRALSHGCIRVQDILPLASIALTGDPVQGIAGLQEAIAAGTTRQLALPRPLPIYVLYWTAVANADGTVGFRDDVYRRDDRLIPALKRLGSHSATPIAAVGCPGQSIG